MTADCNVAIVGGGIAGATAAQTLSKYPNLTIHLFDQGRRGVGGRTSSRSASTASSGDDDVIGEEATGSVSSRAANEPPPTVTMRWDHGCQFFRADTPTFRDIVRGWTANGIAKEWNGDFASSPNLDPDLEFFGLPSTPPFFVGADGMQSLSRGILDGIARGNSSSEEEEGSSSLRIFEGTRVSRLEHRDTEPSSSSRRRWKLHGTSGTAAYHDTPEKTARAEGETSSLGQTSGYDAIILTDVSSSFGSWHRASAGVPEVFAARVRERVGARVPLFSAMIAFDAKSDIPFDAASFDDPIVWFAAKSNSKPGMDGDGSRECWTIVSTPEYAMSKIEETSMQDPKTGEFIPQSEEYLTTVPGPDLCNAFTSALLRKKDGILGENSLEGLPNIVHIDAQRWGSAMPCHRQLLTNDDEPSPTRRVISGVPYDSGRLPLAPTKYYGGRDDEGNGRASFLADESLMLFQAGDMMSSYTPGLEGAALSGYDAAEALYRKLSSPS